MCCSADEANGAGAAEYSGLPREQARAVLAGASALGAAPLLLGGIVRAGEVMLRVTEVEAYAGSEDPASHAFAGLRPRHASMFATAGTAYVYLSYGVHHCLNVVTGAAGEAQAVLLRAADVTAGLDLARSRREQGRRRPATALPVADRDLARGPGSLGRVLGLDLSDDGTDLLSAGGVELWISGRRPRPGTVRTGPRVGVAGAGADPDRFPWRFWLDGSASVSRDRRPARHRGVGGRSH